MSKLHERFGPYTPIEVANAAGRGGLDSKKVGEFFQHALNQPCPSLRDEFAAKAMAQFNLYASVVHGGNKPYADYALACYELADAMLKARRS